ncbi:MAG: extracellular solute-binding protein [Alphaproteobacteria bacterium]|nr:extracellular solute-binding protein [Alphaproteobacteria bacterium]
MRFRKALAAMVAALLAVATGAQAQQLTVWHDLGDNGIRWFNELNEIYRRTHPGVTVTSVSFPTDQWFGRSIAAINSNSAPDLLFNNYERVIRVMTQTNNRIVDLSSELAAAGDTSFITEADRRIATYRGRMIIFPVQRVQMAFGVRTSWLQRANEQFPSTWADVLRLGQKIRENPSGGAPAYGLALQAANPRDLIHMLDLFMFGTGLQHTLINPEGRIVIAEPRHAEVLKEFIKAFTEYRLVSPETVNHSFTDMYRMILGGRAGMFRVGDWNVRGWDTGTADLNGDFTLGPWPAFRQGDQNAVVIGGMRGVAVPENAPNRAAALAFARFLLSREAQASSLNNLGAAVRSDIPMDGLSERRLFFANPRGRLVAYDFPESVHEFYPQLEAEYHRRLLAAIASPPRDLDAFISQTSTDLQAWVDQRRPR